MKAYRSKIISLTPILTNLLFSTAFATTFVVNTTDDQNLGTCSSIHCSLREAILAANANSGQDTIVFSGINRASDPNCTVAAGDVDKVCKITLNTSFLPTITDSVIINGQIPEGRPNIPGSVSHPTEYATWRPGIEISGELLPTNLPAPAVGLRLLNANNSTIKGLVINRIPGAGLLINATSDVKVIGNYFGTDATATLPSVWNSGFTACTANCFGNRTQGGSGIIANGNNMQIGGKARNERNIVANNFNSGISLTEAYYSTVVGNFSGTDVYGIAAMGNRAENIEIRGFTGATRALVGLTPAPDYGPAGSDHNKLDGNIAVDSKTRTNLRLLGRTLLIQANSNDPGTLAFNTIKNTVVINNLDGVNLAGSILGALVQGSMNINDSVIGSHIGFDVVKGKLVIAPNTFVNNTATNNISNMVLNNDTVPIVQGGVVIGNSTTVFTQTYNNAILFNKIYHGPQGGSGTSIGIDLTVPVNNFTGDGVTPNDPMDTDDGPNRLQNFPLLSEAKRTPSFVTIKGSLNSQPNKYYLLQFFANDQATTKNVEVVQGMGILPTVLSEGKYYLGSWIVKTNNVGDKNFTAVVPGLPCNVPNCSIDGGVAGNSCITSTATELDAQDVKKVEDQCWNKNLNINPTNTSEFSPVVVIQ